MIHKVPEKKWAILKQVLSLLLAFSLFTLPGCGLSKEDIPIEARIVTIADVWDAITSDRPYRKAIPIEKAINIMFEERGEIFDPKLFDLFMDEKDKLYLRYHSQQPA